MLNLQESDEALCLMRDNLAARVETRLHGFLESAMSGDLLLMLALLDAYTEREENEDGEALATAILMIGSDEAKGQTRQGRRRKESNDTAAKGNAQ